MFPHDRSPPQRPVYSSSSESESEFSSSCFFFLSDVAECGFPNLISDEADNSPTGDGNCGGVKPGGPTDEGDQPRFEELWAAFREEFPYKNPTAWLFKEGSLRMYSRPVEYVVKGGVSVRRMWHTPGHPSYGTAPPPKPKKKKKPKKKGE